MPNPVGDISKIQLPDGNQYNIKDTVSGYQKELIPGTNITIIESSEGPVISSTGGGGGTIASVTNHILNITTSIENGDAEDY